MAWLRLFWQSIRDGPRWTQIGVVVSAACLVLLCVGVAIVVAMSAGGAGTTGTGGGAGSTPTAIFFASTPQPPVQPTATPVRPHPVGGAELGGTEAAFTARYGAPTESYGIFTYVFTDSTGAMVQIKLYDLVAGTDHQARVDILALTPAAGTAWSDAYAAQLVAPFLPPDVRHVADTTDPNIGRIHIYRSADLALTFPVADFVGPQAGSLVAPGTLGVACDDPSQPGVCTLVLGD